MDIKLKSSLAIYAILAYLIAPSPAVAIPYNVIDLGTTDEMYSNPVLAKIKFNERKNINSSGQTIINGDDGRAWISNPDGTVTELRPLEGSYYSSGYLINDSGDVAGTSVIFVRCTIDGCQFPGERSVSTLWKRDGTVVELWSGEVTFINDSGLVAGREDDGSRFYPVLWQEGVMVDFYSLLGPVLTNEEGWEIRDILGINDDNWILALAVNYFYDYPAHGFLFTPVIETLDIEPAQLFPVPEPGLLS
ncbi:MAG: hypothetical protein ABI865_14605, partial [Nitrosospira sp.]